MKDILVGIDGSEGSRNASDWALRLGELTGRTVRFLNVWPTPAHISSARGGGYVYGPNLSAETLHAAAVKLLDKEVAAALRTRVTGSPITVRADERQGSPGPEIVKAAEASAFVVLGTSGRGRLGNVLESCVSYVAHHASRPVMVVPRDVPPPARVARVVVGVDGSARSRSALLWAHELARVEHADLVAAHAVEGMELPIRVEDRLAWKQDVMLTLPPETQVACEVTVAQGPAHELLTRLAEPGDLLVVGSHGRSGVADALLGSVSAACLAHPHVPVVVVREHEESVAHLFGTLGEPVAEAM